MVVVRDNRWRGRWRFDLKPRAWPLLGKKWSKVTYTFGAMRVTMKSAVTDFLRVFLKCAWNFLSLLSALCGGCVKTRTRVITPQSCFCWQHFEAGRSNYLAFNLAWTARLSHGRRPVRSQSGLFFCLDPAASWVCFSRSRYTGVILIPSLFFESFQLRM